MILRKKWIKEYLVACEREKRLSIHTLKAYRIDLQLFEQKMGEYNYRMYRDSLKNLVLFLNDNYKPKTARRKLASVHVFMRYLIFEGLIDENPLNKVRTVFSIPKTLPKTIDIEVISKISQLLLKDEKESRTVYQEIIRLRNRIIVDLLISTGIRISELCCIEIRNINSKSRFILIDGKGKKERLIYINQEKLWLSMSEYIEKRRILNQQSKYVFLSMKGNPLDTNSVRYMLKKYCKEINLSKHITPHQFRHTFATMLLESDVDIRIIQKILGHSSITTTSIYADVSQDKIKKVMEEKNPWNKI